MRKIAFLVMILGLMPGALAMESDDVGIYGSISISRKADEAARAMVRNDYGLAQQDYRTLIGLSPKTEDFYFGLYESSLKLNQWDQVALALEELCRLNPSYKDKLALEYGECLYHQNRYEEAEPLLKLALSKIAEPSLLEDMLKTLRAKSIINHEKVGLPYKPAQVKVIPKVVLPKKITQDEVNPDTTSTSLNFEWAFNKSEGIILAEYNGYETDGLVTYYSPPKAIYTRTDYLKAHIPSNRIVPIRYEFHDLTEGSKKPKGWKFDPDRMMPKPGSKWILFIKSAVPIDGMLETYHGCYGRMEYNEENYDKIMQIIQQHRGQAR
ncbi:MAG: tetratricopeptide repeat protein [Candidatus Obscuribacterales bacterium]